MSGNESLMIEDAGGNSAPEIFALTDEQILGMESEGQEIEAGTSSREQGKERGDAGKDLTPEGVSYSGVAQEPPGWLAREMKDPWVGDEARELWEGVQRAQREAAAYREAIATPEDARALKEIYPGGVAEAKGAAERARELAEIDAVFFGAAGKPAEELRAGRTALVEKLYAQDPGAFREMVEAGVRILGAVPSGQRPVTSEEGTGIAHEATNVPGSLRPGDARGTQNARSESQTARLSGRDDKTVKNGSNATGGDRDSVTDGLTPEGVSYKDGMANRYREFERVTNAELEKSVGGAIGRAMEAALPNLRQVGREGQAPPLQSRLANAVREEVETALRSDASLGEQVARILSGRRLDEAARMQVVRLIDGRAQQLVPGAVRRVVGSWTQATLGARKTDSGGGSVHGADERRAERAPSSSQRNGSGNSGSDRNAQTDASRGVSRGRVDYRKMSDEQILGM